MYNHLMYFETEKAAIVALATYLIEDMADDGVMSRVWNRSTTIPNQRVVLKRAVHEESEDGETVEISPEITIPGFFITVSLPEIDKDLINLPDDVCRIVGLAETGAIVYTAPDINPTTLAEAIIEPTPLGSTYAFADRLQRNK